MLIGTDPAPLAGDHPAAIGSAPVDHSSTTRPSPSSCSWGSPRSRPPHRARASIAPSPICAVIIGGATPMEGCRLHGEERCGRSCTIARSPSCPSSTWSPASTHRPRGGRSVLQLRRPDDGDDAGRPPAGGADPASGGGPLRGGPTRRTRRHRSWPSRVVARPWPPRSTGGARRAAGCPGPTGARWRSRRGPCRSRHGTPAR